MKYKAYLGLIIVLLFFGQANANPGDCECDQCDYDPFVACSVTGDFGFRVYTNKDECSASEPSCGGIPINSNSWVLLVMGISVLIVGFVVTRKVKQ